VPKLLQALRIPLYLKWNRSKIENSRQGEILAGCFLVFVA